LSLELSLELANKLTVQSPSVTLEPGLLAVQPPSVTLEPGLLAVQIKKIDFFIYIKI
jgi:hypothetical protein